MQVFNLIFQTNSNVPNSEAYLEPGKKSKMEQFVKVVNRIRLLNCIQKFQTVSSSKHQNTGFLNICKNAIETVYGGGIVTATGLEPRTT